MKLASLRKRTHVASEFLFFQVELWAENIWQLVKNIAPKKTVPEYLSSYDWMIGFESGSYAEKLEK